MFACFANQLIVSCQPCVGGPMDKPSIIAAMAQAVVDGGASGVRIEGVRNVEAVRSVLKQPIIGIVKADLDASPIRITPFLQNIRDLASAGADIIAVDATDRPRPESLESAIQAIRAAGALSMADCSCIDDGKNASRLGVDILASTMAGYTTQTTPEGPDLELVRKLATLGKPVIAEGRYHSPGLAVEAVKAGADAVVVGTAITRAEVVTGWFLTALKSSELA